MRYSVIILAVVLMVCCPVHASEINVKEEVANIFNRYIDMDTRLVEGYDRGDKEFIAETDAFSRDCMLLAEYLLKDPVALEEFKSVYGDLDEPLRHMLNPVVELVLEGAFVRGLNESAANYPGYGYPTPGYRYRRGRELSRDALSVFWQKEKLTTEEAKTVTTEMDLSIAAGWGQENTNNGNIDNFSIGDTRKLNINGSAKTVARVTFTTKAVMVAERTVRYQRSQVWHELLRAKIKWFGLSQGDWVVCGKTYYIVQEETGLEVIETPPTFKPGGAAPMPPAPTSPAAGSSSSADSQPASGGTAVLPGAPAASPSSPSAGTDSGFAASTSSGSEFPSAGPAAGPGR